jgi:hypothetical protein
MFLGARTTYVFNTVTDDFALQVDLMRGEASSSVGI